MYVILITGENTMQTTIKQRIMQKSKLVDDLWFLTKPTYNGYNMADFTVLMEYVLPVSREYKNEFLVRAEDYEGYLKYVLPIDTNLTDEAGEIELKLTFILSDLDESGKSIQRVRKISSTKIEVVPIEAWCNIIPDSALSALDQRIIKTDAQIKALSQLTNSINSNKADNIAYNDISGELQLMSGANAIGDKVIIKQGEASLEDGVPIVNINSLPDTDVPEDEDLDNVVEF